MNKNWLENAVLFDIESSGIKPEQSSILSISTRVGNKATNFYAKPSPGTFMSAWSKSQAWEPIKKFAKGNEQQALSGFLTQLESAKTIAGWNIGTETGGGFDIPFILKRAEKYGLRTQFEKAFEGVEIRDIGREYAFKLAKVLGRHRDVIDEDLYRSLEAYRNVGMAFQKQGFTEREAAVQLARSGYQMAGWKQEQAYELLTGKKYSAHQSAEDIAALQEIVDKPIPTSREFAIRWNKMAVRQKTISSVFSGAPTWEEAGSYYSNLIAKANKYGITDIEETIASEASKRGADISKLRAGLGFTEQLQKVGGKRAAGGKTLVNIGIQAVKEHPFAIGTVGVLAFAWRTKPLNFFSGKGSDYNTIEGLGHKGIASSTRKENTDFGSGYQGLLRSKSFWIASGVVAGVGGLAYGIHRLYGEDKDNQKYLSLIKHRFAGYTSSLSKHGVYVGTGHKRILIPKSELPEQSLEELGFSPTLFAIPESGQDRLTSFRNPYNPYHLHAHGDYWSMHKDRHAAITMAIKKDWADNEGFVTNLGQSIGEIPAGLAHIVTEGIPGAYYWLRNKFGDNLDMAEKIRREQGLRFSGQDDVYNVIEGLSHKGIAKDKRHELTDFGSGWIRKALSKGIELEKIAAASKTLGKELSIKETSQGTRWLVGKKMGSGGFGTVFEAFEGGTGRAGIYKHIGEARQLEQGTQIISPAFSHITNIQGLSTRELTISEMTRNEFTKKYLAPTSETFAKSTSEYGGMGVMHESAMQRLAREKFGNMVPQVYGETSTGIFMESAGKGIAGQEERVQALEWMRKEWAGKQLGQTTKFDELGNLIKNNEYLYHLDPQIGNIMKKGNRYMMIDWGVAAKTSQPLERETIYAAEEAFEKYVNIEKAKLKMMQQSMHNKVVRDMAQNSLRPGQGHTKTVKTIVQ